MARTSRQHWMLWAALLALGTSPACGTKNRSYADEDARGGESAGGDSGGEAGRNGGNGGRASSAGGSNSAAAKGGASSGGSGEPSAGGADPGGVTTGGIGAGGLGSGGTSAENIAVGGSTGSGGSSTSTSTPPVCTEEQTLCPQTNTCVDISKDVNHCGACGHACGAKSTCESARCTPALLVSDLASAQGLDVSSKGLFFTDSNLIQWCTRPAACPGYTQQVGAPGSAGEIAVTRTLTTDLVGFFGKALVSDKYPGYRYCNQTSCGTTLPLASSSPSGTIGGLVGIGGDFYYRVMGLASTPSSASVNRVPGNDDGTIGKVVNIGDYPTPNSRLAVDDSFVYYIRTDSTGANPNLVACDRFKGCTTYPTLVSGQPNNFAAHRGRLYWVDGLTLKSCVATDPASTTTVAGLPGSYNGDMIVDENNVYFLTTSSIVYCTRPSCAGGVRTLASGLVNPRFMRSEGGYLYWLATTTTSATTSGIYRVAKP